ncbi:hypothetical protein ADK92_29900 [Streptomyces sp. XY533]|nr:hypothetical protein ADK92_29900 [Streptomyces sp. XY533]
MASRAAGWSHEGLPPLAFDHGSALDAVRGSLSMVTKTRPGEVAARAQAGANAEWRQHGDTGIIDDAAGGPIAVLVPATPPACRSADRNPLT